MLPLEFPFERDRFRHELIGRTGQVYLVERTSLATGSRHWEVVIVLRCRSHVLAGVAYPAREGYPTTKQWGRYGWTFTERSQAERKMAELALTYSRAAPQRAEARVG